MRRRRTQRASQSAIRATAARPSVVDPARRHRKAKTVSRNRRCRALASNTRDDRHDLEREEGAQRARSAAPRSRLRQMREARRMRAQHRRRRRHANPAAVAKATIATAKAIPATTPLPSLSRPRAGATCLATKRSLYKLLRSSQALLMAARWAETQCQNTGAVELSARIIVTSR